MFHRTFPHHGCLPQLSHSQAFSCLPTLQPSVHRFPGSTHQSDHYELSLEHIILKTSLSYSTPGSTQLHFSASKPVSQYPCSTLLSTAERSQCSHFVLCNIELAAALTTPSFPEPVSWGGYYPLSVPCYVLTILYCRCFTPSPSLQYSDLENFFYSLCPNKRSKVLWSNFDPLNNLLISVVNTSLLCIF